MKPPRLDRIFMNNGILYRDSPTKGGTNLFLQIDPAFSWDPGPWTTSAWEKNTLKREWIHIPPNGRLKSGSFGWPYVSSQERVYVVNGTCNSPSDKTTKSWSVAHGTPFSINQYIYPSIMWFHLFRTREKKIKSTCNLRRIFFKRSKKPKNLGFLVTFDDFCLTFCWYHQLPSSESPLSQGFCRPAKAVHRDPLIDVRIWSIDPDNDVFVAGAGEKCRHPFDRTGRASLHEHESVE